MRWIKKVKKSPHAGETRIRKVFAWRRTEVGRHVVWLEFYEVHEKFFQPLGGGAGWWSEKSRHLACWYP
jgi:hypothetical protein